MTTTLSPVAARFRDDVRRGLSGPRKRLPSKYLYDRRGSELFDRICELREYYPTRTELAITRRHTDEIAACVGPGVALVEYGSGSSLKTRLLLDSLTEAVAYVPVDISASHLASAAARIDDAYPGLDVLPVVADFTQPFSLPEFPRAPSHVAVYFPGSTIGNFRPCEAEQLLHGIRRLVGVGGGAVLGIDLQKPTSVLEAAYNDAEGVTAEFNLNLLRRINRELGADFDLGSFRHHAPYDHDNDRIDMLLVAQRDHEVEVAGERVAFRQGESIHTEHSHKYTIEGFRDLAADAGLSLRRAWTDDQEWFAVVHLVADA